MLPFARTAGEGSKVQGQYLALAFRVLRRIDEFEGLIRLMHILTSKYPLAMMLELAHLLAECFEIV